IGIGPLTYQWRLSGTNLANGSNVSGVNTATLLVTNIAAPNRGDYTVLVTDANASALSLPASLTVLIPPLVIVSPQPSTVVKGDLVTLGILVTDAATLPVTFEWRVGNVPLRTNVVDAVTNSFTFRALGTNTTVTNTYRVVVKNAANSNPGLISAGAAIVIL